MEWTEIISAVITSGVVITGFELARDWKNKRNKDKLANKKSETENKKTDYQAQKEGLDLVQEFYNRVQQVTDDQNSKLFKRMDKTDNKIDEIVTYLNGDFAKWKKEHSS